jgi:hypothetical protein
VGVAFKAKHEVWTQVGAFSVQGSECG